MIPKRVLNAVNVVLVIGIVAVLLGCGGDPMDPPKGSVEEKFYGDWEAEPFPASAGQDDIQHIRRTIDIHSFEGGRPRGVHLFGSYDQVPEMKAGKGVRLPETTVSIDDLTIEGLVATAEASDIEGAFWTLRLDTDNQRVMYATLTLKDGSKRLDEVKFEKRWPQ